MIIGKEVILVIIYPSGFEYKGLHRRFSNEDDLKLELVKAYDFSDDEIRWVMGGNVFHDDDEQSMVYVINGGG